MIKKLLAVLLLTSSTVFCKAQFRRPFVPSPEFTSALEKIVMDFKTNFKNIKGDNISSLDDVDTYESAIKLPGASECTISYYHSHVYTTASWQAVMYKGEDYKEATKAYQEVFGLVKKSQMHGVDKSRAGFTGSYEAPKEEVRFVTSTLHIEMDEPKYKDFTVQIKLVTTYAGWEVHLNLQSSKRDDEAY